MKQILTFLALTIMFGCISDSYISQEAPPIFSTTDTLANNTDESQLTNESADFDQEPENITCIDYCQLADNQSCTWVSIGLYPDCNCYLDCSSPIQDQTPQTEPLEAVDYITINFSEALDTALDDARTDFYKDHNGIFTVETSKWNRMTLGDGITIDTSTREVEFNGMSFDALQSSGYVLFYDEHDFIQGIYGVSIFNSTSFDDNNLGVGFDVVYIPELIARSLLDCTVYNKEYLSNLSVAYYYECESEYEN